MEKKSTTNVGKVKFFYYQIKFPFYHRTMLKQYLLKLFAREKKQLDSLTYIFCNDDFLLDINKRYLNHYFYTDVITFDLSNPASPVIGEIYVSIDRVHENATTYNHSFSDELHRVIFHGALHLCGYKDKTSKESHIMRSMEDRHLKKYGNR